MTTEQQIQEPNNAALPLMKWLAENCHPHCTAIVDSEQCEVMEGLASVLKQERPA